MMSVLLFTIIALAIIVLLRVMFKKLVIGKCTSKALLVDKTVLITGADKGIGYETALDLARRKAKIIMACRDMTNAKKAAERIKYETGNSQVFVRKIDVSSLSCVHDFARKFLAEEANLHILINNAGMPNDSLKIVRTEEGFEKTFVTNYLGHFLLTLLLSDLLKKNSPSRIINVSSLAHRFISQLDVSNMNSEKSYKPSTVYAMTKLLQILFTVELNRQLEGTGVTVNCLHPGTVDTNFMNKFPQPLRSLTRIFKGLVCRTPKEGAQTTIHLAVSEDLKDISGHYFSECRETTPSKQAMDPDLAKKVFEASERFCAKYLEMKNET